MGSLNENIAAPGQTSELNVGPSGGIAAVATAVGTSFTAQVQNKIGTSWQNVGSAFSAIDTPQFITSLPVGSAVRIDVTATVGGVDLSLQT